MSPVNAPAALVTGGAARLGRVIALALADAGYDIVLHYNRSTKSAEETAAAIRAKGRTCHLQRQDLACTEELGDFVSDCFKLAPGLKVLINNASVFEQKDFLNTTLEMYRRHHALHLDAPFFLTQAFAKRLQSSEAQGCVVNMIDTYATKDKSVYFAYLLSKKGLMSFTCMSAAVLGPNIRVNAVMPGIILPSSGFDEVYMTKKAREVPLGKTATTEDIANAVLQAVSSPWMTGQMLFVDGGDHLV